MYLTVSDKSERRYCVRITGFFVLCIRTTGVCLPGPLWTQRGGPAPLPTAGSYRVACVGDKEPPTIRAPCSCQIWPLGHLAWPVSLCLLGGVQIEEGSYSPGSVGLWACRLSTAAILVPSSLPCTLDTSKSPFGTETMKPGASSWDGSC